MNLFRRIFFAAVLAGLAAGCVMAAVQQWKVAPLILAAEVFEQAEAHDAAAPAGGHEDEADAWAPQDGIERISYTVLADLLASIGFGLVLVAVSALTGIAITTRNGIVWGLGGFVAFHLAPAFGLSPDFPGMPTADLFGRQVWWWATVLLTGGGMLAIARFRSWPAIAAAAVMITVTQVIGAPVAPDATSAVPAHLASAFAAHTLATAAVFWAILGPLTGWLDERFARREARLPRAVPA